MTILEYIRSKSPVKITDDNVRVILLDRGLSSQETSDASSLDAKTRDLLYADALMIIAYAPRTSASISQEHGGFAQRTGSETLGSQDRYAQMAMGIYKKYDDDRYVEDSGLFWIDNDY